MNPASTTAEATVNPAMTAGWNGSPLGFGPPDGGGAVLSSDPLQSWVREGYLQVGVGPPPCTVLPMTSK